MAMTLRVWLFLLTLLATGFGLRALPATRVAPALAGWWPLAGPAVITLYFRDGPFLFPVSRRISTTDNVPRAALGALLDGPAAISGLTSAIPRGVEIRSFTLSDGVARVDLSAALLDGGGDPTAAETDIVETLTALPEVNLVVLSVEGKPLADPTARTPLRYYASTNGLTAVPASVTTPDAAVAAYMAGPPDRALTGIPRDVRLVSYEYDQREGLVSLNFTYTDSIRTLAIEKPDIMRSVLLGLIATLTELPGVQAVRIDFGGHSRLGLGECSDLLRTPQPRPRLLNDERLLGQ